MGKLQLPFESLVAAWLIASAGTLRAAETVTVSVSKAKDLNLRIYGFVENDLIDDSTQGLTEEPDNNLIARPGTYAGDNRRMMMSIRNSRLGFDLTLPETESGLKSEAVLELDALGNNATNTAPGSKPSTQSERDFFNNPSVRIRHAYLNLTDGAWNAKIGQYWSLLGWQPYYFPAEPNVMPAVGQLYRRFPQIRATNTMELAQDWTLESAADAAKPAEMNSGLPEAHAGLRIASTKVKAVSFSGAGTNMVGLSAALSAAWIPVRSDVGNRDGWAGAADVFLPIISSPDGQDKSNNLSLTGEFAVGRGLGGLEYAGLTLGVPSVATTVPLTNTPIDSGIAGVNTSGALELIQVRVYRSNLQYTLPGGRWSTSAGYARVQGLNLSSFALVPSAAADRIEYGYASVFFDALAWLRFGAEYSRTVATYLDGIHAPNNRYQFTTYFVF